MYYLVFQLRFSFKIRSMAWAVRSISESVQALAKEYRKQDRHYKIGQQNFQASQPNDWILCCHDYRKIASLVYTPSSSLPTLRQSGYG